MKASDGIVLGAVCQVQLLAELLVVCIGRAEQPNRLFAPKDRFGRLSTINCQKEHSSDLAYPRACGIGRLSLVMLEYAPWIRDMCKSEEEKKVLGAFRRRRAAHHLSCLPPLAMDSFSSPLVLNPSITIP